MSKEIVIGIFEERLSGAGGGMQTIETSGISNCVPIAIKSQGLVNITLFL